MSDMKSDTKKADQKVKDKKKLITWEEKKKQMELEENLCLANHAKEMEDAAREWRKNYRETHQDLDPYTEQVKDMDHQMNDNLEKAAKTKNPKFLEKLSGDLKKTREENPESMKEIFEKSTEWKNKDAEYVKEMVEKSKKRKKKYI